MKKEKVKKRSTRFIFESGGKIFISEGKRLSEYKNTMRRRLLIKTAVTGNPR